MVAPAARLVAYSGFDATLIRRAMTAAAVSVFVSKSGDIREILDAIRADVASTPRLSAEVLTGATAVAMTTECLDPVRRRASAVTTGHKPAARASGQASHAFTRRHMAELQHGARAKGPGFSANSQDALLAAQRDVSCWPLISGGARSVASPDAGDVRTPDPSQRCVFGRDRIDSRRVCTTPGFRAGW